MLEVSNLVIRLSSALPQSLVLCFTLFAGSCILRGGGGAGVDTYQPPAEGAANVAVAVSPESNRLQLLTPFAAWDGEDLTVSNSAPGLGLKARAYYLRGLLASSDAAPIAKRSPFTIICVFADLAGT